MHDNLETFPAIDPWRNRPILILPSWYQWLSLNSAIVLLRPAFVYPPMIYAADDVDAVEYRFMLKHR